MEEDWIKEALEPTREAWQSRRGLRDAAVLIPLLPGKSAGSLVLTLRSHDLPSHAGQVAFPGGAREGDESPLGCALRETREELGLSEKRFRVLGSLPERVSLAGFQVHSFVACLDSIEGAEPDAREVAELFTIPIAELLRDERWEFRERIPWAVLHGSPFFEWEGKMLWGLSALIARELLSRVYPRFD